MRGIMTGMSEFVGTLGMFAITLMGTQMNIREVSLICVTVPTIFFFLIILVRHLSGISQVSEPIKCISLRSLACADTRIALLVTL